jgi:hypothetical protein
VPAHWSSGVGIRVHRRGVLLGVQWIGKTLVNAYRKGSVLAIVLGHGKADWVKLCWPRVRPMSASMGAIARAISQLANYCRSPAGGLIGPPAAPSAPTVYVG